MKIFLEYVMELQQNTNILEIELIKTYNHKSIYVSPFIGPVLTTFNSKGVFIKECKKNRLYGIISDIKFLLRFV